jgi:hypothetical protein
MDVSNPNQLADVIEKSAGMVVAALRGHGTGGASNLSSGTELAVAGSPTLTPSLPSEEKVDWAHVGVIDGFEIKWPNTPAWKALGHDEMRERYGPMEVYEAHDGDRTVRLAIGDPGNRYPIYGNERGLLSVWEVANGRPVRQLANFIDVDDFTKTGDRAALISGKDGADKKGFAPNERHLLPPVYDGMRIEVQNDRIVGPNSRSRLVVVAREDDVDVMLNHALAHLRLRR